MKTKKDNKRVLLGRHIVADPQICHGQPAFLGTRVLVSDVLDQLASGMACEGIIQEWNSSISKAAIAEAIHLASEALSKHADEFALDRKPA